MKTKSQKRYRLKVGDKYCTLDTYFHADGVAIPNSPNMEQGVVIGHVNTAKAIIRRTHELRDHVKKSMLFDFPKFRPLLFDGSVMSEEFAVQIDVE